MKNILLLAIIVFGLATTMPLSVAQSRVQTESVTLVETPIKPSINEPTVKKPFNNIFRAVTPLVILILIDAILMIFIQLL